MNPRPRKPVIKQPSALAAPELAGEWARPSVKRTRSGGIGLLGSLGLHACLIAAACSITLIDYGDEGATKVTESAEGADFTLSTAPISPPTAVPPTPLKPAPPRVAVATFLNASDLVLPPVEPWVAEPAHTEPAPQPAASSAKPAAASATKSAKAGGRKGSGDGKLGKRTNPVPPPKLVSDPAPRYPAAAKAAKKTGQVSVLVRVRANGSAAATSVYHSSGNSQLDAAAVEAARSWKFSQTPSLESGATVAVVVLVTFKL